jgi:hypothetical protein
VLLLAAAIWFGRQLVLVAGTAFMAATIPHFAYHAATTDKLTALDNSLSLGAFVLEMAVVAFAMLVAARLRADGLVSRPQSR